MSNPIYDPNRRYAVILSNAIEGVVDQVERAITEGWTPQGGLVCDVGHVHEGDLYRYAQTLVRLVPVSLSQTVNVVNSPAQNRSML